MAEIKYKETEGNLQHRIVAEEHFDYRMEDGRWLIEEDDGTTQIPDEHVYSVIYNESDDVTQTQP
jgi:predicted protein tyrosine phosphatase